MMAMQQPGSVNDNGIVSRRNRTGTVPFTNLIAEILNSLPGQKIAVNQSTAEECSRNQYPTYVEFDVRQHTFQFRQFNGPAAQDLANAGFFAFRNTNNEDSVCCFCCGVVLTNWTQDDDPWVEHAWWFPECRFLKESKGEGFIQLVQRALDTVRNHTVMIRRPFLMEFYEFINSWEDTLINENIEFRLEIRGVRDENRAVNNDKIALEEEISRLQQRIVELEGVPLS